MAPYPDHSQTNLLLLPDNMIKNEPQLEPDLLARQAPATVTVTAIPVTPPPRAPSNDDTGSSNLSGGAIAGIVIGSVAGLLLLLWIVRSCFNLGAPPQERETMYHYVKPERERHHRHRSRHTSRPRRYSHASEVSVPPGVVIPEAGRTRSRHRRMVYEEDGRGRRYRNV
ncbi:hypothetical protein E4U43_000229 [Claviceps pusilla]|uniref:Uncharacterized protein n=1 Tax=Claviceps pusilla TaxID=123648 RepID=A0A9P7SXU6_9HYPO|nr:hypothetical protein E4U43_000229 [Claviceps pusilla]